MIRELKINNLAIIKDVELEFNEKFSSLTGETGAGKSMILDGLALITGSRANTSAIRQGTDKLLVETVISINDNLKDKLSNEYDNIDFSDNELIIYREITTEGKNKIDINGKRVTLSTLSNIMEQVVDIVGQHENQYLLNKKYHRSLLDAFVGVDEFNLKEIVSKIKRLNSQILEIEDEVKNSIEKKDYYEHIVKEINDAELYEGLDDELEESYNLAFNSGRINEGLANLDNILNEYIFPNLKNAISSVYKLTEFKNIEEIVERLEEAREILNDVNNSIEIDDEEYDMEELSNKLNYITKLKKKYGDSIKEILEYKQDIENKLDKIEYSDIDIEKLKKEKKIYIDKYMDLSYKLSEKRKIVASNIEKKINLQLLDLNMKDAEFKIKFSTKQGYYEEGIDEVEFLIKTNKGQDYSRLDKIASGGELSRIMLALKIVFSEVDNLSSLVFDEIDAGISGETIKLVAKKLKDLSSKVQVICVTHSANIASVSDEQFLIYKTSNDKETNTSIKKLNYDERIEEISRIIAGENANSSLKDYVRDMMKGK